MSENTSTASTPRGPSLFVGMLAAFASFAVGAALLQHYAGGKPEDPTSDVRVKNRDTVKAEQEALLKKYGITDNADAAIAMSVEQIKQRKAGESKVVVPGSPTAIKQSQAAPPAAATPSASAPGAPATAPVSNPKP